MFSDKNSYSHNLSMSESMEYSRFNNQSRDPGYKPTIQNVEHKHYSSNDDDYINEKDINLY
jgi:hypothetical protein